ncbi:hypothetical protein [Salegentibacter flavus]|uniref:Uncharacterized protein n=1 Tax=Salegentibacter flavus TaxID=287099 RepID=A0A1I4XH28_9FLAO|nr:hypothetical protein [Salegentibacter flavus]SFN25002.1 hypothetical protein SAMN05660413_00031 [Salegentibacter flavus]
MKKDNSKWKDFLLKSSLPLEYEVKQKLKDLGFWTEYDFSYLRNNENNVLTEFSYDIDATKEIGNHSFELMIECKFRDDSTNWLFLPEKYNDSDRGIGMNSFLNTNDFFYKYDYPDFFKVLGFKETAKLCSKGIEINSTGQNPKTITQAVSQLSFALIEKAISAFKKQIEHSELDGHFIYHHIPIIVTTANLYRLKNDISISDIRSSTDIIQVAEKEKMVLMEPPLSVARREYALQKLAEFEKKFSRDKLNRMMNSQLKKNSRDYEFHRNHLANYPEGVLVIHHSSDHNNFEPLLETLEEINRPKKETIERLDKEFKTKIPALNAFR